MSLQSIRDPVKQCVRDLHGLFIDVGDDLRSRRSSAYVAGHTAITFEFVPADRAWRVVSRRGVTNAAAMDVKQWKRVLENEWRGKASIEGLSAAYSMDEKCGMGYVDATPRSPYTQEELVTYILPNAMWSSPQLRRFLDEA